MSLAAPRAPRAAAPAPDARALLVDALGAVSGLSVHASAPDNPAAFDAFPRWAISTYNTGRLGGPGEHAYDVFVVLPAGYEPDTVTEGDSLLDSVVTGLWDVAEVQTAEPRTITLGDGMAFPALRIRVVPRVTRKD